MVVLILEKVTPGLRGELTRWFLEPHAGVFVGRVSGMVRDRLWDKACGKAKEGGCGATTAGRTRSAKDGGGGCVMAYSSNNEQGFQVRTWGRTRRSVEDFEGLFLVRTA